MASPTSERRLHPGVVKQLVRKVTISTRKVNFLDHRGEPALMSWVVHQPVDQEATHHDLRQLPPLAPRVFYMTNPQTSRDFDDCKFQNDLETDMIDDHGPFRYEFFFLPGATDEECVAHYRTELAARGTLWRQIRKLHRLEPNVGADWFLDGAPEEDYEKTPEDHHLPGLAWPKNDADTEFVSYRGWFFIYPHADVHLDGDDRETRELILVKFDPVPLYVEEGEVLKFDPMQHPIYSKRIPARGVWGDFNSARYWLDERKNQMWRRAAAEATGLAMDLGWESW